ncbi:MAG: zinc-dependent alcohol dehydrogenase [Acidimicrobiales bacterium]
MKALLFEHNNPRYAAARVVSSVAHGKGVSVGPLRLVEMDTPPLPGPDWQVVRPALAGICGSDLATLDSRSSRYFESLVSFPFVPGHEVVGHLADATRVVVEAVLGCATRDISPPCPACAVGDVGACTQVAFGHLRPGLQTGYCVDTGGAWSGALVAHDSQIHPVPEAFSNEDAVMVEPVACAIHAALSSGVADGDTVVVLGAGTLGLCVVAALRRLCLPGTLVSVAKHPTQHRLASELGADVVVEPGELRRAVRRLTRSLAVGPEHGKGRLTGGADVVLDCVGSADAIADSLAVVRPRGRVVLVGMPGKVRVDMAPLWQREVALVGAYAYGREVLAPPAGARRTFDLAFELVRDAGLGRLVSARYPLERFEEAVAHAAAAGRRGSVKVVFDLEAGSRKSIARRGL